MVLSTLQRYKTVIWDWNGTLLDDVEHSLAVVAALVPRYGGTVPTREQHRELFTFPVQRYYEALGIDFTQHSFSELASLWLAAYEAGLSEVSLFADVETLLRSLSGQSSQFILSAYPQEVLEHAVSRFAIETYFSGIYGMPHHHGTSKLERGKALLAEHSIDVASCVLFGVSVHDADVARDLGIDVVLIAEGHQSFERLCHHGTHVFENR